MFAVDCFGCGESAHDPSLVHVSWSVNGQRLLELLEGNPIVDVAFVAERLDVARTTVSNLVKDFVELRILVQREKEKQRYRTFLYKDFLAILRQGSNPL